MSENQDGPVREETPASWLLTHRTLNVDIFWDVAPCSLI
jgi:hypothetical protein